MPPCWYGSPEWTKGLEQAFHILIHQHKGRPAFSLNFWITENNRKVPSSLCCISQHPCWFTSYLCSFLSHFIFFCRKLASTWRDIFHNFPFHFLTLPLSAFSACRQCSLHLSVSVWSITVGNPLCAEHSVGGIQTKTRDFQHYVWQLMQNLSNTFNRMWSLDSEHFRANSCNNQWWVSSVFKYYGLWLLF